MSRHRTRGLGPKWAGKADSCFYLNGGNDHASDCDKVMLESGTASYITNATYALPPSSANRSHLESGFSALLRRRRPPRRWEGVEPVVWLVNRGKATPSTLPLCHRPHLRRGGETSAFCEVTRAARSIGGGITLPSLSPVLPSTEEDTSSLRNQSKEWRKSDRLEIPAQQDNPLLQSRRHTVTPAVTRSAARTQRGRSARGVYGYIREGEHQCGNFHLGRAPFRQP